MVPAESHWQEKRRCSCCDPCWEEGVGCCAVVCVPSCCVSLFCAVDVLAQVLAVVLLGVVWLTRGVCQLLSGFMNWATDADMVELHS